MKEILFGWLTKGRMFISVLDVLVLLAEIGILVGVIAFVASVCEKVKTAIKEKRAGGR